MLRLDNVVLYISGSHCKVAGLCLFILNRTAIWFSMTTYLMTTVLYIPKVVIIIINYYLEYSKWYQFNCKIINIVITYVEKTIDERVVTRITHSNPVGTEPNDINVLVPEKKKLNWENLYCKVIHVFYMYLVYRIAHD